MSGPRPADLAVAAARACDDKSATDVVILDVGPVLAIVDAFVVASASNDRQVRAVVDAVQERLREDFDRKPRSVEGLEARRWVLLDYGDIVVHVFLAEERSVYRLERLYGDAPRIEWRPDGPLPSPTVPSDAADGPSGVAPPAGE
ncbi:MAG: ribosome silencing factor [Microthrixaceae bacterium]